MNISNTIQRVLNKMVIPEYEQLDRCLCLGTEIIGGGFFYDIVCVVKDDSDGRFVFNKSLEINSKCVRYVKISGLSNNDLFHIRFMKNEEVIRYVR